MKNKLHNLQQRSLVLVLLTLLAVAPGMKGWGQLLLEENFNYTVGALLTANGWTAHSGAGTNAITVVAPLITYPGYVASGVGNEITMKTSGEDVNRTFAAQTSGTVYAAFLVNVNTSQATGDYFFHIGPTPTTNNIFQCRVFIKKDAATTNFAFGLNKASTAGTLIYSGFNYFPGTTYLVVAKYTFNPGSTTDDVVSLFVNPAFNTLEPAPLLTVTDAAIPDLTKADFVALRQGNASNAANLQLDGIRIGKTWSEVVNNTITAPTLQATNVVFSNVTFSGLTATWTKGNGNSRAVFMKQANTGTAVPVDNTTYTANTTFGFGSEITGTGWFCVYNGTGTTVDVTGLSPSTDYIVMVCEYNDVAGAEKYNTTTAAGNPNTTTTPAATTPVLTATSPNGFGNICISTSAGPESFTINGSYLTTDNITVAVLDGYTYSTTPGGTYELSLSLPQPGGTYSQIIYVMFSPVLVQSYNGNIVIGGGGAATTTAAATGSGVNTAPAVTTISPATDIGLFGATCSGDVTSAGCQSVTERGMCYGTGFGPTIAGTHNIETGTTGVFSSIITGLTPNTLYHFRAYATSSAGTSYGADQTFTTLNLSAPVATVATNISSIGFTANWEPVTGALGYYLDVYTASAGSFATDLFISEYVEGTGNTKYIEIFNGTASTKDLSDYKLQLFTNGAPVVSIDAVLSGALLSGQTIVYQNSGATLYTGTAYNNSAVNFNGDDAVALYRISTTAYTDIFGTIGEDPGAAWTNGTYSTFDKTLVRKETVAGGVTTNPPLGFPTLVTEWDLYPVDDVSHLGAHTFSGGTVTYHLGNFDAGNVTSYDVLGLTPNTQYHFVVRAYFSTASSPNSNVIDVTTNPAVLLTVSTEAPTAITSTTATGNGTIVALGSSATTARGFCWDLAANPDPDITDFIAEETGSFAPGSFTGIITLLAGNTSYKVRAYATDALGTTYGAVQTFSTLKAEPSNHATAFAAGTPTTTTIPLTWNDAVGPVLPDAYLIKGSTTSYEAIVDPVDGTPETNGVLVQNVNQGMGAYTFTALTPGTPYFFKIYSYTNSGTGIDYKPGTIPDPTPTATAITESLPVGALLYESFDYAAGDFIGGNTAGTGGISNNWTTHSNGAATTGTIDLLAGSLSYSGLAAPAGNKVLMPGSNATVPRDVNRAVISNSNTVMFFSALINVLDTNQLATAFSDNSYFIHFSKTAGAAAGTFFGRLHIKKVNGNANYRLGIQNTTGGTPTQTEFESDLAFGTTYLVVVKYDFDGISPDIATLWVNPSSLGVIEPAGGVSNSSGTSTTATLFGAICLRNASATPKAEIDEIRVGSTWADVTPAGEISKTLNLKLYLEGLCYLRNFVDPPAGQMYEAFNDMGEPNFGAGVADKVTIELHDAANYANPPVLTFPNVELSTTGNVSIPGIPASYSGPYYITIKHRSSIETTTAVPVLLSAGTTTYDFSTAAEQAYGSNMKPIHSVFAIFGGNANQDPVGDNQLLIDSGDMNDVENASVTITFGYVVTDCNGDGIVDSGDMNMVENNSVGLVGVITP